MKKLPIARYGLPIPALLICLCSMAQPEGKDLLMTAFRQYQSQTWQEKLFLHVDRSFYVAGETVWFKIYAVDEATDHPDTLSAISYVELIGKDGKPWLQSRIGMDHGSGNGSFQLPASLPSGNYLLRAYTAWMKNFSPGFFFSQPLTVINTLGQPIPWATSAAASTLPRVPPDIRFFPEGGNLVAGLTSRVGFKAVQGDGSGEACQGAVLNGRGDTVARFASLRFGMGSFVFTPERGERYEALVQTEDTVWRVPLPQVSEQGYVMSLTDPGGDQLQASLRTNMLLDNPRVYLVVQTRNAIKAVYESTVKDGLAGFAIDKSSLGDGISQCTIFNGHIPLCERVYFSFPRRSLHIGATLDRSHYGQRKLIGLDLTTTGPEGAAARADLSVAVFRLDSLQMLPANDILSYLLLSGDLRGHIDSPRYYFTHTGPEVTAAIDNLMLTQGWTRFRWEDVLQSQSPALTWLPEPNGNVISGRVVDKRTGSAAPSVIAYLSVPGRHFLFAAATSKADGEIRFHLPEFYGNTEMVVETNTQTSDSNYRVDILNPFSEASSPVPISDPILSDSLRDALLYRSIDAQVENSYRIALKHRLIPILGEDSLPCYGRADLHYNLDDYTRFVTLEEVIREYVLDVHLHQTSGKYDFRVRNALFNTFFEDDPLILLDGVPIFDANKIVNMDPLKIRSVDVVTHRFYINSVIADGILSYRTYDGDLAGYPPDPNAVAVQYSGVQQPREFYAPVYDSEQATQNPIPDLRNLLLWDPAAGTDDRGKKHIAWYTSDKPGTYAVVVQGLTGDGMPGSTISTFTVDR